MCTQPDIAYAVRELARFMSNYGAQHYAAAKFLLRYLQGTHTQGIIYGDTSNPAPIFHSFCDSDWAMSEGRKSISGYVIMCGNGPISWSSKQQTVMRSRIHFLRALCTTNNLASIPFLRTWVSSNRTQCPPLQQPRDCSMHAQSTFTQPDETHQPPHSLHS